MNTTSATVARRRARTQPPMRACSPGAMERESGAASTAIYQPGLLARGPAHTAARAAERWAAALLPALPVVDLARAMVADAEAALGGGGRGGEVVVGDKEIRAKAAAAGR